MVIGNNYLIIWVLLNSYSQEIYCFTVRDITKVTDGNNSSFVKNLNASILWNLVL